MTLPLTPDELLSTTRSVRKRLDLDRPVPVELVRECVEVALQAPSGSNTQGWHWMVVTDPELRAGIAEQYRRSYAPYRASRPQPEGTGQRQAQQARVTSSADHLAEVMHRVPVHVIKYESEVAELLGIPPHVRQGVLLPTAYFTGETFRPAKREPLDTVLHLDRW